MPEFFIIGKKMVNTKYLQFVYWSSDTELVVVMRGTQGHFGNSNQKENYKGEWGQSGFLLSGDEASRLWNWFCGYISSENKMEVYDPHAAEYADEEVVAE